MQDKRTEAPPGGSSDPAVDVWWPQPDVAQVVLIGEHDMATVPMLEQALDDVADQPSHLVVDLTRAEFIDSSIINALLQECQRAKKCGVGFILIAGENSVVRRPLEITGLLGPLNNVESLEEALLEAALRSDESQARPATAFERAPARRA